MERKLKIYVSAAEEEALALLRETLEGEPDMLIVGQCCDGREAYGALTREKPDVLVTDLLLPGLDGLSLLRRLRDEGRMPNTIVISSFVTSRMAQALSTLGVQDYLPRPCDAAQIARRVREAADPSDLRAVQTLDPAVREALRAFGVPPHLHGRQFAHEGLCMVLRDRSLLHSITKALYPELAKRFHTNADCIERSIRSAIAVGWERGNAETRRDYFDGMFDQYDRAPSNGRFFADISEFIELSWKKTDAWQVR